MTPAQVRAMMLQPSSKRSAAYTVNFAGQIEEVALKTSAVGKYEGKLGSPRRSRKGRTYRMANGYTKFVHEWWEPDAIVAYKV